MPGPAHLRVATLMPCPGFRHLVADKPSKYKKTPTYHEKVRTGFILHNTVKILLIGLLPVSVFPRLSAPQSRKVKLSFSMLTASHAALGAPMTYQIVVTNTSRATTQIEANVKLVDPNGASFTLLSTEYTL